MEKQSHVESQFDALKQMLDREIAFQEDSSLKDELQNVLDALEGQKFEEFEGNLPQDMQQDFPQFEPSDNLTLLHRRYQKLVIFLLLQNQIISKPKLPIPKVNEIRA